MACDYFQRKKKIVMVGRVSQDQVDSEEMSGVQNVDDRLLLKRLLEQEQRILSGVKQYPSSLPYR